LIEVNPLRELDCRFDDGRQFGRGKTTLGLRRRYKTLKAVQSAWHSSLHCVGLALLLFRILPGVTNNAELARRMALLRDWGQESKYQHVSGAAELQAAAS
jgi:hypothetical protein